MGRTNIEIDDDLIHSVMMRYDIATKREAVDFALRQAAGTRMSLEEFLAMEGAFPGLKAYIEEGKNAE